MSEDGYTLAEALAALAILSLAITGLASASHAIGMLQGSANRTVADVQAIRASQQGLENLFEGQGPFRTRQADRLRGDADDISFDCHEAERCRVALVAEGRGARLSLFDGAGRTRSFLIPRHGAMRLGYRGSLTPLVEWPPTSGEPQNLRSITLTETVDGQDRPVLDLRLWREQAEACAFDTVIQDCR